MIFEEANLKIEHLYFATTAGSKADVVRQVFELNLERLKENNFLNRSIFGKIFLVILGTQHAQSRLLGGGARYSLFILHRARAIVMSNDA